MQYVVCYLTNADEEKFWTGEVAYGLPQVTLFVKQAKKFLSPRAAYDAAGEAAKAEIKMGKNQLSLLDFKVRQVSAYERRLELDAIVASRIDAARALIAANENQQGQDLRDAS